MQQTTTPLPFTGRDNALREPLDQLASFLRGELSAIETYNKAMRVIGQDWVLTQLRQNLASHEDRIRLLRQRIIELGGDPPDTSGPWGAFANALEGAAAAINDKAALAILEEGERHGLADYRADLTKVDTESLRLLESRIIPQQARTYDAIQRLVQGMAAS